jgi:hypothetical protein
MRRKAVCRSLIFVSSPCLHSAVSNTSGQIPREGNERDNARESDVVLQLIDQGIGQWSLRLEA